MLQQGNEPWHTGTKSLLRGAKGTTYEGGPRVPGIVRYPGVVPARQVCADPASTLDLLPTLAAFAGAEMPKDRVYDGFDLGATLRGKAPSPRTSFHYFLGAQLQGIREGAWKFRYARPWAGEGATATEPPQRELFHLDHDPAELYNVAARYPETAAKLEAKMRAFAAELKAQILPE
jgi:uncharacterized sulfatase